jgi:hypothetical protein
MFLVLHASAVMATKLLVATFMVLNFFLAVVVNAMQAQVSEDLKDEGEAHTRLILDEVRALRREVEALRELPSGESARRGREPPREG